MFHTTIGNLGHLSIIISFASALLASFGYFMANANNTILTIEKSWLRFSKITFYIHSAAVIGIVASLFTIIYNHYYEYYYAWSHSSNSLPTHYMISSFWEGQEG
ncbi:MAG: cytochrome C biogenesis protein, partial [Cytophagales bacterium]